MLFLWDEHANSYGARDASAPAHSTWWVAGRPEDTLSSSKHGARCANGVDMGEYVTLGLFNLQGVHPEPVGSK